MKRDPDDEPTPGPSSAPTTKKPKKARKSKKLKEVKLEQPLLSVTDYGEIHVRPTKPPKPTKTEPPEKPESPPPQNIEEPPIPTPPPTPNESDDESAMPITPRGCSEKLIFEEKITEAVWSDAKDIIFTAIEEIALEGLDGITVEALWTRMSTTLCQPLPFSKYIEKYIWDTITQAEDIEFYMLPTPRPKLVVFDRFKSSDQETGYIIDSNNPPLDIYPFAPVSDKIRGVIGSCSTYKEREDISDSARGMSVDDAMETYGNKLVIVASQELRDNFLIPDHLNTFVPIHDTSYYILERIGRSRRLGELTCGSNSLATICKDSKTLFYYRKVLHKHHFITKQPFCFKSVSRQNTSGNLFHLLRFHNDRKSRKQIIIEQIIKILKTRPQYRMEYLELRRMLGLDNWEKLGIVKLVKSLDFRQFVKTDLNLLYREVYPNAKTSEWKRKGNSKEKTVRVFELINPFINVNAMSRQEEEQKDSSSDEEPVNDIAMNVPLSKQCYDIILQRGKAGVVLKELQCLMGTDFYTVRAISKILVKNDLILSSMVDAGRQRYTKYFAKCFKDNEDLDITQEECPKEQYGDDTYDFIADILGVDSSCLKGGREEPPDESPVQNKNPLKGAYDKLKKMRQGNMELNKIERFKAKMAEEENFDKIEKKKVIQEIYCNSHGYVDHQTSVDAELFVALSAPEETTADFRKVVNGFFNIKQVNPIMTLYPDKCKANESTIDFHMEHKLIAIVNQAQSTPKIDKLKHVINKLVTKPPNNMAQSYKTYLQKLKTLMQAMVLEAKAIKDLPSDILSSDDEALEDTDSLANNLENGKCVPKSSTDDTKPILIDYFQTSETIYDKLLSRKPVTNIKKSVKRRRISDGGPPAKQPNIPETPCETVDKTIAEKADITEDNMEQVSTDEVEKKIQPVDTFGIKHESFMGPEPDVIIHNTDNDGIETKVLVSTKPENCDTIKSMTVSERVQSRALFIKQAVSKHKVISDISKLLQLLIDNEKKEGYVVRIDRKSLFRIYTKLVKEGAIKMLKIMARYERVIRCKTMITHPDVDIHTFIESAIEQFKMSFFLYAKRKVVIAEEEGANIIQKTIKDEKKVTDEGEETPVLGGKLDVETGNRVKYRYSRTIGRTYGFYPKVAKMRVLHEFLYYLVYDYNGGAIPEQDVEEVLNQHCDNVDAKLMKECSTLYQREASWKMFIPALPDHKSWSNGWLLICDALLRLPVSIFVKIFNVTYVIPELPKYYLNHPIRKHFLVKNLPPDTRDAILSYRKYIFSIHEVFCYLCYLGLLQFGPQKFREKDQQFVFLNKNAVLHDTSSSDAGYHHVTKKEYPKLTYHFDSVKDVESYWSEMFSIAMRTKLGQRTTVLGKYISLENVHSKPKMIKSLKQQTPESALEKDVGYIAGDGLGACCCDSALWIHVKRNWIWSTQRNTHSNIPAGHTISGIRKKHMEDIKPIKLAECFKKPMNKPSKIRANEQPPGTMQLSRKISKKKIVKSSTMTYKKKAILRKVRPRKQLPKREQMDPIDKDIINKMGKSRAVFCQEEDNLILLCKAVIEYMCPNFRKRVVVNTTIRDFIHRVLPYSRKTSKAYKRRIVQLKKSENLEDEKKPFSFNLNADYFTQKHFKRAKEKLSDSQSVSEMEISLTFLYIAYFTYKRWKAATPKLNNVSELMEVKDYLTPNNIHKYDKLVTLDEDESIYQDAVNEDDLNLDTIKAVIHSSLGCQNASQEWPYQLLKVYQSFSENLLRIALNFLRDQQLISGKKAATKHSGGKEGSILMRGTSYHLSFAYTFKQITKYPSYIFNEAHDIFLSTYKYLPALKTTGKSTELFEQGHSLGLSEIALQKKVLYLFDLPNDMISLNPNALDTNDLIKELALRYMMMMSKKTQDADSEESTPQDPEVCRKLEAVLAVFLRSQLSKDEREQEKLQESVDSDLGKMFDGDANVDSPTGNVEQPSTSAKESFEGDANEDEGHCSTNTEHSCTKPQASTEQPSIGMEESSTGAKQPYTGTEQQPIAEKTCTTTEQPSASRKKRFTYTEQPSTSLEQPAATGKESFTRTEQIPKNTEQPSGGTSHASTSTEKASSITNQTSAGIEMPSTSTDEASGSTKRPYICANIPSTSTDKRTGSTGQASTSIDTSSSSKSQTSAGIEMPSTNTDDSSRSAKRASIYGIKPSTSTDKRTGSTGQASTSIDTSSSSESQTSAAIEMPSTSTDDSSGSAKRASIYGNKPSTGTDKRTGSTGQASTSIYTSSSSISQTSAGIEMPSTSTDDSSHSAKRSSICVNQPSTYSHTLSGSTQQASTSTEKPSINAEQASTSTDKPSISTGQVYTCTEDTSSSSISQTSAGIEMPSTSTDDSSLSAKRGSIYGNKSSTSTDKHTGSTEQASTSIDTSSSSISHTSAGIEMTSTSTDDFSGSAKRASIYGNKPSNGTDKRTGSTGQASTRIDLSSSSKSQTSAGIEMPSTSTDDSSGSAKRASIYGNKPSTSTDKHTGSTEQASTSIDTSSSSKSQTSAGIEMPSTSTDYSSLGAKRSSSCVNQPSTNSHTMSGSTPQASTSTEKPSINAEQASTSTDKPSISTEQASTGTDEPSINTEQASTSTDKPSISTEQASTSTEKPSISTEQAPSSIKKPSISTEQIRVGTNNDLPAEYCETFRITNDRRRKGLRISDLAFLLTKGLFPELDDDERLETLNKHFVVRYPTCMFYIPDDTMEMHDDMYNACHREVQEVCGDIIEELRRGCIVPNIVPNEMDIKFAINNSDGGEEDTILADKIVNFIYSQNIYGASSKHLKDNFKSEPTTLGLEAILIILIEVGVVLRVGICNFAFVHFNYRHNWTIYLDSSKNPDLQKNTVGYRVKISPWIRIDGTVHMKVLINWLSIILSHCLSFPFVPLSNLSKRFCYVKPVDIFYILEFLQQLSCLKIFTYSQHEQEDLFSDVEVIEQVPAQITDDFSEIFVETDNMACIKFGAFLNRDKTDYNIPFEE